MLSSSEILLSVHGAETLNTHIAGSTVLAFERSINTSQVSGALLAVTATGGLQ